NGRVLPRPRDLDVLPAQRGAVRRHPARAAGRIRKPPARGRRQWLVVDVAVRNLVLFADCGWLGGAATPHRPAMAVPRDARTRGARKPRPLSRGTWRRS